MAGADDAEQEFYAMAENGNSEPQRVYNTPDLAAMGERVSNLNRRQTDFEAEVRTGFRSVENQITAFTNETRAALSSLSANLAERNKPQWQALSVMLVALLAIGSLAYWPIREKGIDIQNSLERLSVATTVAIEDLRDKAITRQELDWRGARGAEDRTRNEQAIRDLRDTSVTRLEWSERNQARDQQVADLQRQLDQNRQDLHALSASLGNGGDNIRELREDQDRLRDRLAELLYRRGGASVAP